MNNDNKLNINPGYNDYDNNTNYNKRKYKKNYKNYNKNKYYKNNYNNQNYNSEYINKERPVIFNNINKNYYWNNNNYKQNNQKKEKDTTINIIDKINTYNTTISDLKIENIKSLMDEIDNFNLDGNDIIKLILIKRLNKNSNLDGIYNDYIDKFVEKISIKK